MRSLLITDWLTTGSDEEEPVAQPEGHVAVQVRAEDLHAKTLEQAEGLG